MNDDDKVIATQDAATPYRCGRPSCPCCNGWVCPDCGSFNVGPEPCDYCKRADQEPT